MRKQSGQLLDHQHHQHHQHHQRAPRRISGQILIPFLLFLCLGGFALGGEISRLPLAAFASAIVRPAHTLASVQGQLAHAAPEPRVHVVATGTLGGKPIAPAKHTSARLARHQARATARASFRSRRSLAAAAPDRSALAWTYISGYAPGSVQATWNVSGPWEVRVQWASPQA
jgi:hypothetical protein